MTTTLRHDALIYSSDGDYVRTLKPFVEEGLHQGEAVVCVTTADRMALLSAALDGGGDGVAFIDAVDWYRRPGVTVTGYARVLDEHAARGTPRVRVIGEVQFGETPGEHASWTIYESSLNSTFASAKAWIVCPYDARRLPPAVVDNARRTHPAVWENGARAGSSAYMDPHRLWAELTPSSDGEPALDAVWIAVDDLTDLRARAAKTFRAFGLPASGAAELVAALHEVAANALRHGSPPAACRLRRTPAAVVCEVSDSGPGIGDPFAGSLPPDHETGVGFGLWLARQLTDRVDILQHAGGHTVRLVKFV